MTVRIPDNTNGLVTARENSVPLLLFSIIRVEVKTAGNAAATPPSTGPPIWLKSTEVKTSDPAPTPRKTTSRILYSLASPFRFLEFKLLSEKIIG